MNRLVFLLLFFVSASVFADSCQYDSPNQNVHQCDSGDLAMWRGLWRVCLRNPGVIIDGKCVKPPEKCPDGNYSEGLYDYGTDSNAQFPVVACAGGCNVSFSGSAPAYSRLIDGVTHYYAQGSYDYMGGYKGQCSGSDAPSSIPSLPPDSCPSGQAFDPVTKSCKPVDPRECPPGQTFVDNNGVTSCVSGPCPPGTNLGEYNGKPICLGGGSGGGAGSGGADDKEPENPGPENPGGEDGKEGENGGGSGVGGGGGSGGGEGEAGDDKDKDTEEEKNGLEKLLDNFLKHKTYSQREKGKFDDNTEKINQIKLDIAKKVEEFSNTDFFKLRLPEGVGALPCKSISFFGKTLSFCLREFEPLLSDIGSAIVFIAAMIGAIIIFRG